MTRAQPATALPPRAWIATIQLANGGRVTTTIRGYTPSEAEDRAVWEIKNAVRAIAREECKAQ